MQKCILLFGACAAIGELTKSMPAGDNRPPAPPAEQPAKPDGDPIDRHHKQAAADFAGWAEHPELPDHVKQAAAEQRDRLLDAKTPEHKRKALKHVHMDLVGMHQDEDVPSHVSKQMLDRMQTIHVALK
ncbi:hypothetical protein [Geminicoccus harenae]|uniref:hypothetical protein n=1 Tax=Geminicoccus harenae TaxID=2498453 RepID=UPI00168C0579|nr:hypothetical protein [Geminicoccus harenae]